MEADAVEGDAAEAESDPDPLSVGRDPQTTIEQEEYGGKDPVQDPRGFGGAVKGESSQGYGGGGEGSSGLGMKGRASSRAAEANAVAAAAATSQGQAKVSRPEEPAAQ